MGKMPEGSSNGKKVTCVLTSCGRHDLLERTLDSFFQFNTYPIDHFIVMEDGPLVPWKLAEKYPDVIFLCTGKRVGQVAAIDMAYSFVKTEYIFHMEDDWQFYKSGFIEQSMAVLEEYQKIICVWIRSLSDTNNHPLIKGGPDFKLLSTRYHWKGFTWNPGLRRLRDYQLIRSYGNHVKWDPLKPWTAEQNIGILYFKMGFMAAILNGGFVRHIGTGRHVNTNENGTTKIG